MLRCAKGLVRSVSSRGCSLSGPPPQWRSLSSLASVTPRGGVHGSQSSTEPRQWRNKALLRVHGEELFFKTGTEAVKLLVNEAKRRDGDKPLYLEEFESYMQSLTPVFDRSPRYAWLAKILLELERMITFRVAYIDDSGNTRTNRGYRIQYSSTLGPYEGGLHFGRHVNADMVKSMAFNANFGNALTGQRLGGASGGSNFEPSLASDAESRPGASSALQLERFAITYVSRETHPLVERP